MNKQGEKNTHTPPKNMSTSSELAQGSHESSMRNKFKSVLADYLKTNYIEIFFLPHRHTKIESILPSDVQTVLPPTPTEVRI